MINHTLTITDVTLRDGMHALAHQYTTGQMRDIARKLDEAGVPIIEVTHGDGLSGASFNYGFPAHSDIEYITAVKEVVTRAKIAALLLPGIGTIEEMRHAREAETSGR